MKLIVGRVVRRLAKRVFEGKSAGARQKAQQDWTSCEHFSFASPLRYLTQQMRILTKNTAATRSTTRPNDDGLGSLIFLQHFDLIDSAAGAPRPSY
ncbi:hypothetical protein [Neisseria dentiae]|uniref:hypothetical protein n=1 Tax=Neisseria dentiae TaxID=194197 RepID=UPI000A195B98|nr:hypothetical protein [Neisseria dentiae]QMT44635.1 hypothetical protein H3L92_09265 [Neisseria dentiae]